MKILFTNRLNDMWLSEIYKLRKDFPDVDFVTFKETNHPRLLLKEAEGVVGGHFSEDEIKSAKNLRIIFVPWTGVNMLPWNVIKNRGIIVTNTHSNAESVAEHAVALCMALMGRIVEYHNDLSKGIWHGFPVKMPSSDFWIPLHSKTCGIVGIGNIGKNIAKILKAFDCHVIGFKKHPTESLPEYTDEVSTSLNDVISRSDIVFIAIPLTPETKGMLSWKVLSKMEGKFLINVSRGEIVDEEALYRSVKEGILAGVAIDTWYQYPSEKENVTLPSKYPIHSFKNVVISPHISGVTKESVYGMIKDTIENIKEYLRTGKALNRVNPDLMY